MARKSREEAEETARRILDAAEAVFCDKGVAATTLHDIATAAGVTRGAIYGHFRNKGDLFNRMHERVHLPIEALAAEAASPEEPDPLGSLRHLLVRILMETAGDEHQRRVLEILFHKCERVPEVGSLVERQQQINESGRECTRRLLDNAVARDQLPAGLDTARAAIGLHASITGLLSDWLLDPQAFDLAAEAEPLVDAWLAGVATAPSLQAVGG
ncbi:MAG: TetR family transcriptional regulator [Pseudomonadota bacterium]